MTPLPFGEDGEDDFDEDGNSDLTDESLTKDRTATPNTKTHRGVSVTAINHDDIETVGASGGGSGTVAVNVSGAMHVATTNTRAWVGEDALINVADTNENADQDVLVAAGNDSTYVGIAAALSIFGVVAVTPGADILIANHTTEAFIDDGARVEAERNIHVVANSKQDGILVAAGVAGSGTVAVGDAVAVLVYDNTTRALIGDDAATDAVWASDLLSRGRVGRSDRLGHTCVDR